MISTVTSITGIILGASTLYIAYKSPPSDRMGNSIFLLMGLGCFASGMAVLMGKPLFAIGSLITEHYLAQVGIMLKLISILKHKRRPARIVSLKQPEKEPVSA